MGIVYLEWIGPGGKCFFLKIKYGNIIAKITLRYLIHGSALLFIERFNYFPLFKYLSDLSC